MKISVCIASRERPAAMIGVVMALHRMRSTKHEIDFVIGLDADDERTAKHLDAFEGEIAPLYSIDQAPPVRGMIENRMIVAARDAPGPQGPSQPLGVITLMSDRTFCITPAWDEWLARGVETLPNRVTWWQCPEDPGCIIPIIPTAYLDAAGWKWSPEIFPFWWDDTWHQEIDLMIHGPKSKKARCTYAGIRGATANGREFRFWLDVFIRTRDTRRDLARAIAGRLGVEFIDRPDVDSYFAAYDHQMIDRCPAFEERFGDKRPVPQRYVVARDSAMKLMSEIAAQ